MIRWAMEVGNRGFGVVFCSGGETVERLCTGVEAFLGVGHNGR